ncbi:HPP family protein [Streptomyces sp. NPDC048392]|uniref:HPP family protein n=1 Tax=Streptomyces sp. NPDC048392 TaxID=3365543 RepID=UPI00371BADC3
MTARALGRALRVARPDPRAPVRDRFAAGLRLSVLSVLLLVGVGFCGRLIGWVALTTTIGPTAYVLLAHPGTVGPRLRHAVLAHASAVGVGLACLAAFGLWNHPSIVVRQHDTTTQILAQAIAVGVTLLLLHVLNAPHPPAAATALLITSGISRPGPPLYGMLTGLSLVLAVASLLTWVTSPRAEGAQEGRKAPDDG